MTRITQFLRQFTALAPVLGLALVGITAAQAQATKKLPYVYTKWKNFTVADGLPNDHIFSVKADGNRVWIGTEDGLAMYDKMTGKMKSWTEKDGLPWRAITGIDVDKKTGDVWLALFGGGLARFSGGRFDHFTQMNSGLVNDVVYGVAVENDNIWAATTAGASRYNKVSGEWTIFTEKNAPMEEIWNYNASYNGRSTVYLAVWGSGVLEYDIKTGSWKEYVDPDGEMEIDLYRDDGIVHVITTAVAPFENGFFVSTYFGASRYDGRHWRGYYNMDSGTPSDFMNSVKARSADEAWFCTDKGLGVSLNIPLRNRAAQATQVRSEFEYRQAQLRIQQIENQVRIEVRNAQFGVQQNRASVASAQAAVDLARQSLDAEQKKYKLGASTSTLVLQNQAAMTQAEVTLVSAKALYEKAEVELDRAIGLLLDHAGILIADAERGQVTHTPSIPHVAARPIEQTTPANPPVQPQQ